MVRGARLSPGVRAAERPGRAVQLPCTPRIVEPNIRHAHANVPRNLGEHTRKIDGDEGRGTVLSRLRVISRPRASSEK